MRKLWWSWPQAMAAQTQSRESGDWFGHRCVQRAAQLGPGGDPQLGEDPVQVAADRAVREVEPLPDLAVGQALRGHLGDLQLLPRQLVAGLRGAAAAGLARG